MTSKSKALKVVTKYKLNSGSTYYLQITRKGLSTQKYVTIIQFLRN